MDGLTKSSPRWIAGIEPAEELLSATGTEILDFECRQQPAKLRELIDTYSNDNQVSAQLAELHAMARSDRPLLFLGMGGSLCSAISGATLLQSHGRTSFAIDAGEWLHYGTNSWKDAALSILLTTSGESAELVELFKIGSQQNLALISNNPASTCWRMAKMRLPILAGPEYGNATKTYTNSTAASIIAASEILGRPWKRDAESVAQAFSEALPRIFALRNELESFCRGAANIEIVGRGSAYGSAVMGALTIREMSGFRAAAHTGAGFKHGPNLDVNETHVAIIFALGRVAELGVKLAAECNRRGGKVLLVSANDHERTETLYPVKLQDVPEPWESVTSILIPQALTLAMIERTGCILPPRFQYGAMEQ